MVSFQTLEKYSGDASKQTVNKFCSKAQGRFTEKTNDIKMSKSTTNATTTNQGGSLAEHNY